MKTWPASVKVAIDPSQFPDKVADDLRQSLRTRQVHHKFHYESHKQAQKWLAVHHAFSPFQTDSTSSDIYRHSFRAVIPKLGKENVHVIGLGCGSGQKDAELLAMLKERGVEASYSPVDVSLPLVLRAHGTAIRILDASRIHPVICDLLAAEELPALLDQHVPENIARIVTFFGMIPNFQPSVIMPRLAALLKPIDYLLFSANLAPGTDYGKGLRHILPQYDNPETRDWLLTFLLDLGIEKTDGDLRIELGEISPPVEGVVARFYFNRARDIEVAGEQFRFQRGEQIRLFFSCRHTPSLVAQLLKENGLVEEESWINSSGEEGVFCVRKK